MSVNGLKINNFQYADDTISFDTSEEEMEENFIFVFTTPGHTNFSQDHATRTAFYWWLSDLH